MSAYQPDRRHLTEDRQQTSGHAGGTVRPPLVCA